MRWMTILKLLRNAVWRWYQDNTFEQGAALAFYTIFSLSPVVLIAVAIGGLVFGREAARRQISEELALMAGPQVTRAFEQTAQVAYDGNSGVVATIVGGVLLLVGATTVFSQLQSALNTIWGVKARPDRGWLEVLKDRFWSFALVLGIGFLLLVSLVLSAALSALGQWLRPAGMPDTFFLWRALNFVVSFGLITILFAMIYKFLPDVQIAWGHVWVGAAVTAFLFTTGKHLIGLYIGQSGLVSAYGAAGSLVMILLWVYYSSQVLLLGAEFTYVFAHRKGAPLIPTENAEPLTAEARARQGRPPHLPAEPVQVLGERGS